MKPTQLITSLICFALWETGIQAATKYWDIDGATPGAGGNAPSGTWNAGGDTNWTTDSTGSSSGTTWADGDDAVFSAGTDATNAFTITLDYAASPPVQTAGNLTFEEGAVTIAADPGIYLNIGGGVAGKGIINVADGLNATISAEFDSLYGTFGDNNGQLTKTGTGTLTLSAPNFHGGTNVILQGVVVAADSSALGSGGAPTIVSNGAAVHLSGGRSMVEPAILSGDGIAGTGALRGSDANSTWSGGVILASDARIETAGARLDFVNNNIEGTNGGNNFNLTIGGDGGRIRCNNATVSPYDVPINLGSGTLTKEGTTLLQLENTNTCGAFYFNGGDIYPRNDAGWAGFGQGPIYVGPGAGNIRASFQDVFLGYYGGYNVSLASGANLGFDAAASWTLWVDCTFTGLGGIAKRNTGFAVLTNYHNTYTGNTTIENGTLILASNSSISNSAVIEVQSSTSALNVSSDFVLQAAQTLKCNGTCNFSGNLTLLGNVSEIGVDKLNLAPKITVLGTVTNAWSGTMTVSRVSGPALLVGDNFPIFNQAVPGAETITVVAGAGGGIGTVWTNKLWVDGSIEVLIAPEPDMPATGLTIEAVGPTSFLLGGQGATNTPYSVYSSTNVALPMTNWTKIGMTNSDAGGVIQYLDTQATSAQRFYRFGQP